MLHKTLELLETETDTDQGTFVALVSAWTLDREGDTIDRHAFDTTIAAWQQSGKRMPLLFDHSAQEIGSVDPKGMRATDEGLVVPGEVDRSTETGRQAWRAIKRGTASFSIGYLTTEERRTTKGRDLLGVDLFEVSYTPTPMHPDTRALSWKNATAARDPLVDEVTRALLEALS